MMIRLDFVFSYWIFAWFLLYYFKFTHFNPFFALEVATIENIILFLLMIYYKVPLYNLISFLVINFFIKVLPLIHLWDSKIIIRDIIAFVIIYLIYLLWLLINKKTDVFKVQHEIFNSLVHGKSDTPFMALTKKLKKYIKKN